MDGEWVANRPVRGSTAADDPAERDEKLRPASPDALAPEECRTYMRTEVAKALKGIVAALIEKAREGSMPHAKGLIELCGLDKEVVVYRREKTLEEILLEQWERDAMEG